MNAEEICAQAKRFATENQINLYDFSFACGDDIKTVQCVGANALNDSYSVTKLFVTTAVGILTDRKLICLDDSIIKYLKRYIGYDYNPVWDRVTIRHALCHSMGIEADTVDVDVDDIRVYGGDTLKYALERYPTKEPGSVRIYTDTAHYLLARVVTAVSGMPCEDFIQNEILNPLKFGTAAWERDTEGYMIGSSGGYMRSADMIKIAMLYRDCGLFGGKRILSEEWTETVMREQFDLYPAGNTYTGKGGMNGQMTMFSREKDTAAAWHSYACFGGDIGLLEKFVREIV